MSIWLASGCAVLAAGVGWWAGRRMHGRSIPPWRRQRLAAQQNANGESLLEMALQMERHARALERMGLPDVEPRAWARASRRIAVQHLACVNALLIEAGPGVALLTPGPDGDAGRDTGRPGDPG